VNLLAIETSSEYLSLAVFRGGEVTSHHVHAGQRHAELILDAISTLLGRAGIAVSDLEGIAYGAGPGSFTGLRIACGVAQGLALARGLKVIGIGTLLAVAEECDAENVYACIDARMGEVYHAAYSRAGHAGRAAGSESEWTVVLQPGLSRPQDCPVPDGAAWCGAGSGFAAHAAVLQQRFGSALDRIDPATVPTAEAVLRLARPRFERGEGAAADSAVPVYIRDKVALKTGER
jgi:tRNA threonylcarbamoyladenosine biosynthesis protein TsaB